MKGESIMKKNGRGTIVILIWAAVALIVAFGGLAGAADDMQILLEKLRADKKLIVSQNMQLTESEARAFWPVYARYQDELFLLRVRTTKMISDYAATYETMTNDTARKILEEYLNIEMLGWKLRQAYLPEFRKILPEMKVLRYFQIENKIQAALMYELAGKIPLMKSGP
jgi:hypothetical protein